MLEVVRFADTGRYGIRNGWTGIILTKKNGKAWEYRSAKRAALRARKISMRTNKRMARLLNSVNK